MTQAVYKKPSDWTKDDIASFWDWQSKNIARQQQYFTATMAPGIVKFIKKKELLKGDVLDYGCGAGHLLQQLPFRLRRFKSDFTPRVGIAFHVARLGIPIPRNG